MSVVFSFVRSIAVTVPVMEVGDIAFREVSVNEIREVLGGVSAPVEK